MTNDRPDRNTGTGTLLDPERDWNNRLASLRDNESETVREKQRERGSERTEKRTDVLIFFPFASSVSDTQLHSRSDRGMVERVVIQCQLR
jgi:hypothetical protein